MRVIGTSGHVDHGKSTLVEKLSGINPDRLAEEQSRQMTIDLGFAWMRLPRGETVGIVDVPGHRDFIENMLAGVGGIDAALLVIAADEGIMPQTREHLAILRLLDVKNIIVVISKADLIDDAEWMELVRLDIEELLDEHILRDCPIIEVSAQTGAGIDELVNAIETVLADAPQRADLGQPRLPIDRVFVISGFGTVVTGTLSGGTLIVGDRVELQPSGRQGRVRGLQSYKQTVESAEPGSRVAVNIAGISSDDVRRGDVLAFPGQIRPTLLIDAHFHLLADAERPLAHNAEVKLFNGAAESIANVRLLNSESLAPDDEGWLQIRLRQGLPLARGDRFVLRTPSPAQTIGGGVIVNAQPGRRRKRFQDDIIQQLETQLSGTPAERLALSALGAEPIRQDDVRNALGYSPEVFNAALDEALKAGAIRQMADGRLWAAASWRNLAARAINEVAAFHRRNPLRLGMPRPELRSRLKVKFALLDQLIADSDALCLDAEFVRLPEHKIAFSPAQQAKVERLMQALASQPYAPPSIDEMNQHAGEDTVRALLDLGKLVNVSDRVAFARESYDHMVEAIRQHIRERDEIDAKTLRDMFATSRKYAIAVLEHLDSLGITQRVGDVRKRGRNL